MTKILRVILNNQNYDSVNNYIHFYKRFTKSNESLIDFYKKYTPKLRPKENTCVGLGLELLKRMKNLDAIYKNISKSMALVSCEESVSINVKHYVTSAEGPHQFPFISAEKEHVVVGVSISIQGRHGVLIADPGYHVGRIVTVMKDKLYPHTGVFYQRHSDTKRKRHNYFFNKLNDNYLEWHEREMNKDKRRKKGKYQISIIYIGRPYLSGVEVTEKRNIVYNFRSLLRRDSKGNIIAGFYFPLVTDINVATFTVFLGLKAKAKYRFVDFLDPKKIPQELKENLNLMCRFMNCSPKSIINTISRLAKINANELFMKQVFDLNNDIRAACKWREGIAGAQKLIGSDVTSETIEAIIMENPKDNKGGKDLKIKYKLGASDVTDNNNVKPSLFPPLN